MRLCVLILSLAAVFLSTISNDSFAQNFEKVQRKPLQNNKPFKREKELSTPFLYSRADITIIRKLVPEYASMKEPTAEPMIARIDDEMIREKPSMEPAISFDVEIRDGMSLYNQSGWFDMSSYDEKTGMMLIFSEPTVQPIIRSTQYAPIDILFIDKLGKITQIVPSISLSDLEDNIYPESPVLAFLILKGGLCAERSINVGDEVVYHIFKKPPVVLNAPVLPKEPEPKRMLEKQPMNDNAPVLQTTQSGSENNKTNPIIYSAPEEQHKQQNSAVKIIDNSAKQTNKPTDKPTEKIILQKSPDELERRIK